MMCGSLGEYRYILFPVLEDKLELCKVITEATRFLFLKWAPWRMLMWILNLGKTVTLTWMIMTCLNFNTACQ